MKIVPFTRGHLEDAADIFAGNYKQLRLSFEELPIKYENKAVILPLLERITNKHFSAAALEGDRLIGYMTGAANLKEFKGSAAGVYVPEWGHSAIEDNKEKIYYELYRFLSKEWVANKNYTHCLTFYANDAVLKELFYQLCFGLLVIDGLMPVEPIETGALEGVVVREAVAEDVLGIMKLHKHINVHLSEAPVFLRYNHEEAPLEETIKMFINDGVKTFVAERDGEIISSIRAVLNEGPNADIVQDEGTLGINFGYTNPEIRGSGIATNVLAKLIDWGVKNGMKRATVDFESQNREGARFWLRHFKPICYSVIRKVDDRV